MQTEQCKHIETGFDNSFILYWVEYISAMHNVVCVVMAPIVRDHAQLRRRPVTIVFLYVVCRLAQLLKMEIY